MAMTPKHLARRVVTDDQLRQLDELRQQGMRWRSIAAMVGVSYNQARNAHYKLQQRRALMGTDIGASRYIHARYK